MLQNAYFLAEIGADTAENEQHFAEICQKLATTLRVRRADGAALDRRAAELRRDPQRLGARALREGAEVHEDVEDLRTERGSIATNVRKFWHIFLRSILSIQKVQRKKEEYIVFPGLLRVHIL